MKTSSRGMVWVLAVGIFLFGLLQGFAVSVRKPLWNDEIYSHVTNVEAKDWWTMWRGGIEEGNNAPLFYSIQKAVCGLSDFKGGDLWHKFDLASMIILRISPVVFMSFGLAFIFWYFARTYSMAMGAAGLLMSMATYLVWAYWAEARPYAMVFALTAIQAVVLMRAFRFQESNRSWLPVVFIHLLLAFTTPLSVIQVGASALILWLAGYRKVVSLGLMVVVPLALGFWYHFAYNVHYDFYFASYGGPLDLIKSAMPESRIVFLLVAPLVLWVFARHTGQKVERCVWLFLGWVWLTVGGYVMLLLCLWIKQKPNVGFEISNRYLMVLAPIGVIATMFFIVELYNHAKYFWSRALIWVVLLILILPRLVKVFRWAATLN